MSSNTSIINPRLKFEDGQWVIHWSEPREGKPHRSRRHRTGKTVESEAESYKAEWLGAMIEQEQKEKTYNVRELIEEYYTHNHMLLNPKDRTPTSAILAFFGDYYPHQINAVSTSAYIKARKAQGIAHSTLRKELVRFRAVLNHAVEETKILAKENLPSVPKLPPAEGQRDIWLDERQEPELLALAAATSKGKKRLTRIHRFVWIGLGTGGRRRSVEKLTWPQVDFKSRVIDLRFHGRPTRNKRRAIVPIRASLMPLLKQAYAERINENVLDLTGRLDREFAALIAGTPFAHLIPHDMRKTFATLLVRAGVALSDVASYLGDSLQTVERVYAIHVPGNRLHAGINRRREIEEEEETV